MSDAAVSKGRRRYIVKEQYGGWVDKCYCHDPEVGVDGCIVEHWCEKPEDWDDEWDVPLPVEPKGRDVGTDYDVRDFGGPSLEEGDGGAMEIVEVGGPGIVGRGGEWTVTRVGTSAKRWKGEESEGSGVKSEVGRESRGMEGRCLGWC